MRNRSVVLGLGVAAALLAAGCGRAGSQQMPAGAGASAPALEVSAPSSAPTPTTAAPTALSTPDGGSASAARCPTQGWGTGPTASGTAMSTAPLYLVRAGQHGCYDRVVFDI